MTSTNTTASNSSVHSSISSHGASVVVKPGKIVATSSSTATSSANHPHVPVTATNTAVAQG